MWHLAPYTILRSHPRRLQPSPDPRTGPDPRGGLESATVRVRLTSRTGMSIIPPGKRAVPAGLLEPLIHGGDWVVRQRLPALTLRPEVWASIRTTIALGPVWGGWTRS